MIDVKKYIELIKDLDYVAIKFETPYLHKNFANEYTPGKDLDLIVSKVHQSESKCIRMHQDASRCIKVHRSVSKFTEVH